MKVMLFGVGAFTQGVLHILKEHNIEVCTYLTRDYAHYGPMLEGKTYHKEYYPDPCEILKNENIDFVIPMSIDWAKQSWTKKFLSLNIPILSPKGEAYNIEGDREFSHQLCEKYNIPFPKSYLAKNKFEALEILKKDYRPYVIKNIYCSPFSPVHTIVCETPEQTKAWFDAIDFREGIFLQEFMGYNEAGHIAFVSNGQIYSLVTNQEYKRAFNDNLGIIAGAPLGGIVEQDPDDKYNIAKELLHPLLPWFKEVNYNGPIQVTAMRKDKKWYVLEYNIRLGVTSGPLIIKMLKNPAEVLYNVACNKPITLNFDETKKFGCSLTLAGYGYPYVQINPPKLPIQIKEEFTCDVWWNEVDIDYNKNLFTSGHRIADFIAYGNDLQSALSLAYENIKKVECPGSYYRTDIGKSMWPPIYD